MLPVCAAVVSIPRPRHAVCLRPLYPNSDIDDLVPVAYAGKPSRPRTEKTEGRSTLKLIVMFLSYYGSTDSCGVVFHLCWGFIPATG